jgi:hypothetical protein
MTTAYNGRVRGGPSAAYPRFSGKLSKVTGEGEQVELAFTAATPEELAANLAAAGAAASARLATNNDAIVRAGATFEERQRQVYDGAVAQLRQEVQMMTAGRRPEDEPPAEEPEDEEAPVGPPKPGDAPAEDEEPNADAAARSLHASTDP